MAIIERKALTDGTANCKSPSQKLSRKIVDKAMEANHEKSKVLP